MNAQEFLDHLARLPDLLTIARQQTEMNYYLVQDQLRVQYRQEGKPFLYSMPMRHLYFCPVCGQRSTDILHELEDPRRQVRHQFGEGTLHKARAHGVPPEEDTAAFLLSCTEE